MENFEPVIEELVTLKTRKPERGIQKWADMSISLLRDLDRRGVSPQEFNEALKTLKRQLDGDTKANMIRSFYAMITDTCRKKFGLVTPNYYQNQWMILGMTVFGLPFGLMFSLALDNFAFFTIGLPIGMPIGIAVGAQKDKKAKEEGLQLSAVCEN